MAILRSDIEHLSNLARIRVSEAEQDVLREDLEEILEYVSQIKSVAADLPLPEAGELCNVLREDINPYEARTFTEDILRAAPSREGDRFVVKKIL